MSLQMAQFNYNFIFASSTFFGRKLSTALSALDKQYMPPSHFPSKIKEKQRDIKIKGKFYQHAKNFCATFHGGTKSAYSGACV